MLARNHSPLDDCRGAHLRRYSLGASPISRLKTRLKELSDPHPMADASESYCCLFTDAGVKNCTVTLRPIGNESGLPSRSIRASRISRSLLSDGSPVEMLFLPIIVDTRTTDPLSLFPSRASAWITTFCPTDTLSTSLSSISALMCREEVSARLNNGRGVTVLKDSPRLA